MTGILLSLLGGKVSAVPDPYFEYTTLLLPGNGTNGAQNNTFLDSSTNNFTITRNGNATQGTFSPFSQTGWSNYFDGTGDYLSVANNTGFDFGSSNFTIEAWAYFTSFSATNGNVVVSKGASGSVGGDFYSLQANPSGVIQFFFGSGSPLLVGATLSANRWYHLAVTRSGNNFTLWVDGSSSSTATSSITLSAGGPLIIGSQSYSPGASDRSIYGYVSNLRTVKTIAVYTGAFTPPTSPLTATQSAGTNIAAITGTETSLLTCQSNRFRDASTNNFAITVNGNTSVQAFSPFNPTSSWSAATYGGSGYFDGNGDYLTVGSVVDWTFLHNGSSWTVQFDLFYSSTSAQAIVSTNNATGDVGILIDINNAGANQLRVAFYRGVSGSSAIFSSNAALVINAWNIVSITFESSTKTCSFYVNGVAQGSSANTGFAYSASAPDFTLGIGRAQGATPGLSFTGYISNLRISNSVRTGLTTLPTSPFTSDANTSLLLNYTNAGVYDATSKNDLETVGNAQISTAINNPFGLATGSMYFDGNGDCLTAPSTILEQFGTANFTIEFWFYKAANGAFNYGDSTGDFILRIGNAGFTTNSIVISTNNSQQITAFIGYNGSSWTTTIVSSSTFSLNTWYYCALVRAGTGANQTALYVNGTSYGTATNSTNLTDASFGTVLRLGASGSDRYFNGYLQDFRITNGYARTVTTSPTAAFPTL